MSQALSISETEASSPELPLEMYRQLFEYASDAVLSIHLSTMQVLSANPRLAEMTGFPVKELVGESIDWLVPMSNARTDDGRSLCPSVVRTPGMHEDVRLRCADDHHIFVSMAVSHAPDTQGTIAVCILRDATERRLLERELINKHAALRQAHCELLELNQSLEQRNRELAGLSARMSTLAKQASVGVFTAGVAHSINNPLAALVSACRQSEKLLSGSDLGEAGERLRLLLRRKQQAAERIQGVVEAVRRIHREGRPRQKKNCYRSGSGNRVRTGFV